MFILNLRSLIVSEGLGHQSHHENRKQHEEDKCKKRKRRKQKRNSDSFYIGC
jgi:hypothetical protein